MNGKTKREMKNWKYPWSYGFHYFRLVYYFHYLMTTNIYISPYNIFVNITKIYFIYLCILHEFLYQF